MLTHDASSCPYCLENKKGRTNHRGHWGYRKPRRAYAFPPWEIAEMKRPRAPEGANGQQPNTGEISRLFPLIVEYLTEAAWEDGSPRELATLLIFIDGHRWKVCLNDRATSRVCFVSGADPEEALSSLEAGLAKDSVDWRPVARKIRAAGRPNT